MCSLCFKRIVFVPLKKIITPISDIHKVKSLIVISCGYIKHDFCRLI